MGLTFMLGRSFLTNDDPAPTVDVIRSNLKIYPYASEGVGLPIALVLQGGVQLGQNAEPQTAVFQRTRVSPSTPFHPTTSAITRCWLGSYKAKPRRCSTSS